MTRAHQRSPLFPYTTLFRSELQTTACVEKGPFECQLTTTTGQCTHCALAEPGWIGSVPINAVCAAHCQSRSSSHDFSRDADLTLLILVRIVLPKETKRDVVFSGWKCSGHG